jgi:predicted TIM-barrel fold metal-dependent hydrolase
MIEEIPLIDAHIHAARLETLKPSWDQWVMQGGAFKPEHLYDDHGTIVPERFDEFLAAEGVDIGLVFAEYSPRVTGIQAVEDVLPLVKHNPARVHLVANINPHLHHPAKDELERQLQLGAVALKIHPVHGGFPANARELYPAYGLCEDEGVPVVFHCGTSNFPGAANRFADPISIEDIAKDFPKLRIVLAHGGRGWWYDAAAFLALMRENIWIEISGLPPKRLRHYYRNQDFERLAEKFIFGTDWPGCPGIGSNASAIAQLGISQALIEKIYYRNALFVYGLRPVWEDGAESTSRAD